MGSSNRILVAAVGSLLAAPLAHFLLGGDLDGVSSAYRAGGLWMLAVSVLLLGQVVLLLLGEVLGRERPAPLAVTLLGPALVFAAGAVGYQLGMGKVVAVLAMVSAADKAMLFGYGFTEAALLWAFGLLGAGVGLVVGALLGALTFATSAKEPARRFASALSFLLCATLGAWALGRGLVLLDVVDAYATWFKAPAEQVDILTTLALDDAASTHHAMHLAVGVAFLLGVGLLVMAGGGAAEALRLRPVATAVGVALALAAVGLEVQTVGVARDEGTRVTEATRVELPRGLELPRASAPLAGQRVAGPIHTLADVGEPEPGTHEPHVVWLAAASSEPAQRLLAVAMRLGAPAVTVGVVLAPSGSLAPDAWERAGAPFVPAARVEGLPLPWSEHGNDPGSEPARAPLPLLLQGEQLVERSGLAHDLEAAVASGSLPTRPLVLHVAPGTDVGQLVRTLSALPSARVTAADWPGAPRGAEGEAPAPTPGGPAAEDP